MKEIGVVQMTGRDIEHLPGLCQRAEQRVVAALLLPLARMFDFKQADD